MNIFAAIERIEDICGSKVQFYSIIYEGNEINEFYDFLNRMEDYEGIEDELDKLLIWIERISENYGAHDRFFRHEGITADAAALPPPRRIMQMEELEVEQLRLYCLRANEHVVFLFNGGVKTPGILEARDCPNVGPYIMQANVLAGTINKLFQQNIIEWNEDFTDISIGDGGIFEL